MLFPIAALVRMPTETSSRRGVSRRIVSQTDPPRVDTTLSFSPAPKLHGERHRDSALFDLRNVVALQVAQADAITKRAPATSGFVDVKSLLGIDHASNLRAVVPAPRPLVPLAPPRPPPQMLVVEVDRSARVVHAMWAFCLVLVAVVAVMAVNVLG